MAEHTRHRVVIIGGGFGGLQAAVHLKRADIDLTLIDRRNFHLFQPLLYQVATGALSPGEIASPLRGVLKRHKNTTVMLADVTDIDVERHRIRCESVAGRHPSDVTYDTLIVAAGAGHAYFGHDEWEPLAPGLKTLEDALELRRADPERVRGGRDRARPGPAARVPHVRGGRRRGRRAWSWPARSRRSRATR